MVTAWHQRDDLQPIHGGTRTLGHVVAVKVHDGQSTTYQPTIEFRDSAGELVRFTSQYTSTKPLEGASAEVSYDPHDPHHAHDLSDAGATWQWPFFTGVVIGGFAILVAAVLAGVLLRQRRATSAPAGPVDNAEATVRLGRDFLAMYVAGTVVIAAIVVSTVWLSSHSPLRSLITAGLYLVIVSIGHVRLRRVLTRRAAQPPRSPHLDGPEPGEG